MMKSHTRVSPPIFDTSVRLEQSPVVLFWLLVVALERGTWRPRRGVQGHPSGLDTLFQDWWASPEPTSHLVPHRSLWCLTYLQPDLPIVLIVAWLRG